MGEREHGTNKVLSVCSKTHRIDTNAEYDT
jgi:hypothetical protein